MLFPDHALRRQIPRALPVDDGTLTSVHRDRLMRKFSPRG
jgi:hypothetical protein